MSKTDVKLGELAPEGAVRYWCNLETVPLVAGTVLAPGERVFLIDGEAFGTDGHIPSGQVIGVVDPFLEDHVYMGERFWCFLKP